MTHLEVRNLRDLAVELVAHLIEAKCTNFHVNHGMGENIKRLEAAVKTIDDSVNPRLKEIHTTALALYPDNLEKGIKELTEAEQAEHETLYNKFLTDMAEENKVFELFKLDEIKCEQLQLTYRYAGILSLFI